MDNWKTTTGVATRFDATLAHYLEKIYCVCPKCSGIAVLKAPRWFKEFPVFLATIKASCLHCAFSKTWDEKRVPKVSFDPTSGKEPFFGLSLYLKISYRSHRLFALNEDHLRDLYHYVEAKVRPRPANRKWSMVNRLPEWLKLAKNREGVLKALMRLKEELISSTQRQS